MKAAPMLPTPLKATSIGYVSPPNAPAACMNVRNVTIVIKQKMVAITLMKVLMLVLLKPDRSPEGLVLLVGEVIFVERIDRDDVKCWAA